MAKPTITDLCKTLAPLVAATENDPSVAAYRNTLHMFDYLVDEPSIDVLADLCATTRLTAEIIDILADFLISRYPDELGFEGLCANPNASEATLAKIRTANLGLCGREGANHGLARNPNTDADELHTLATRDACTALIVAQNPCASPHTLSEIVTCIGADADIEPSGDFHAFTFDYRTQRSLLMHYVACNPATNYETLSVLAYTDCHAGAPNHGGADPASAARARLTNWENPPYNWRVEGAMRTLQEARVDIAWFEIKAAAESTPAVRRMLKVLLGSARIGLPENWALDTLLGLARRLVAAKVSSAVLNNVPHESGFQGMEDLANLHGSTDQQLSVLADTIALWSKTDTGSPTRPAWSLETFLAVSTLLENLDEYQRVAVVAIAIEKDRAQAVQAAKAAARSLRAD